MADWRSASGKPVIRWRGYGTSCERICAILPIVKPKGGELEFIAERDPRILYDRMVAFYVGHGVPVPLSSAEFQRELADKFPEREGMFFLSEQVAEFDKKRAQMEGVGQMSIFVEDEKSAIDWLRGFLKNRPIHPTTKLLPSLCSSSPQAGRSLKPGLNCACCWNKTSSNTKATKRCPARFTAISLPRTRICAACPRMTTGSKHGPRIAGMCLTRESGG